MQNHAPPKSNYAVQDVIILIAEKLIYYGYVVTTAKQGGVVVAIVW